MEEVHNDVVIPNHHQVAPVRLSFSRVKMCLRRPKSKSLTGLLRLPTPVALWEGKNQMGGKSVLDALHGGTMKNANEWRLEVFAGGNWLRHMCMA